MHPSRLLASRLVAALPPPAQHALAAVAFERSLPAGTWCTQQGAPCSGVSFVLAGNLEILSRSAEDGLDYLLPPARAGDDIGLAEAIAGIAHTSSARAMGGREGGAIVATVAPGPLLAACASQPALATGLMSAVAAQACAERACRVSPVVDLARARLDERVWELLPRAVMQRHRALPLAVHGGVLVVGFVDPGDQAAREEVQRAMPGQRIRAVALDAVGFDLIFRSRVLPATERRADARPGAPARRPEEADDRWFAAVKNKAYDFRFIEVATLASDEKTAQVPGEVVVALVNRLIGEALDLSASDIHIEPTETEMLVRYRVDGQLRRRPEAVERKLAAPLVSRLKVLARMDIAERRRAQDGRIAVLHNTRRVDLRLATVPTRFGERIVLRILDPASILIDLEKLLLVPSACDAFKTMLERPQGMVLVAGPTGSGKTTTIYSSILRLRKADINILTIEDPIEYGVEGVSQVQVNEPAGVTFATAVRNFLRQDPDVLVVGETRDAATAATSVEAALTGHLVLTSLHANDAVGALMRLREMGVEPFLLAHTVIGVVSQRLVRRICAQCREPTPYHRDLIQPLGLFEDDSRPSYTFFRGRGCQACNGQGYRGRAAAFEVFSLDEPLRAGVASGLPAAMLRDAAISSGQLQTLGDYCRHLITAGLTTPEEIARILFVER